jgi:hypothetical protein
VEGRGLRYPDAGLARGITHLVGRHHPGREEEIGHRARDDARRHLAAADPRYRDRQALLGEDALDARVGEERLDVKGDQALQLGRRGDRRGFGLLLLLGLLAPQGEEQGRAEPGEQQHGQHHFARLRHGSRSLRRGL